MSSLPDPDQSAKMEEKIIIAESAYPVIFNTTVASYKCPIHIYIYIYKYKCPTERS